MRRLLLAANWKMNKTAREAEQYANDFLPRVKGYANVDLLLCPSFTALPTLSVALSKSNVQLGAQDVAWKPSGAFTGEVSAAMLSEFKVSAVIIGHSERRQFCDETNELIVQKIAMALSANLTPILCVGENLMHRKGKREKSFVQGQLNAALGELKGSDVAKMVIAYEPVWAIGTGKAASAKEAEDMHAMIREWLSKKFSSQIAAKVRIIYGGSANAENCRTLLEQPNIDGLLPGGASLDSAVFATMAGVADSVGKKKA